MKKIIITGGNGFIASLVKEKLKDRFQIVSLTRNELDLSNIEQVQEYFQTNDYDFVFHTGAMAQTADCEKYPELAETINVESTKQIVDACKKKQACLIFASTEQVYNGLEIAGPFKEVQLARSITRYGQHKIACENYIKHNLTDFIILRFSWMFGLERPGIHTSPNIIHKVMNAMFYKEPTAFTVNEIRGMTYAQKLADQFVEIMKLDTGVYHITDINIMNTYEAAKYIAGKLGFDEVSIDSYILADHERYKERFRDYRLNSDKVEAKGIHFGTFEENVEACLSDYGWLKK